MKKITIAVILALGLLLVPSAVTAASGIQVVGKTGDGVWTDNTWQVEIYPGESKSTTLNLYNSSSSSLGVEVNISPSSLDNGNLTFELDKANFTMLRKSYADITLTVKASGSATPGTYTAELGIKSEVPPEPTEPEPVEPEIVEPTPEPVAPERERPIEPEPVEPEPEEEEPEVVEPEEEEPEVVEPEVIEPGEEEEEEVIVPVKPGTPQIERKRDKLFRRIDKLTDEELARLVVEFMFYYITDKGDIGSYEIKADEPLKWMGINIQMEVTNG